MNIRAFRVERHGLGPRLYVFRHRVHECHAGIVVLLGAIAALVLPSGVPSALGLGAFGVGIWLLVKDWRDLVPAWRDERAWRAGLHRPPRPLREARRADWLPPLTGWLAGVVGVVNIASALTPDLGDRARLVRHLTPHAVPVLAHAFALSAGTALVVLGFYLARRRRA